MMSHVVGHKGAIRPILKDSVEILRQIEQRGGQECGMSTYSIQRLSQGMRQWILLLDLY